MVTCYLRYVIDPSKLAEFEHYGKLWIPLVEIRRPPPRLLPALRRRQQHRAGAVHLPSLAAYETYRNQSKDDPACAAAFKYAEDTRCILSYERSFFRPVFG